MTAQPAERAAPGRGKVWLFRVLTAAGIPAILFLSLEGGLRLAGYGQPAGFMIPDARPGYYRTNPEFLGLFLPKSFNLRPLNFRIAARKPPDTIRVVVLGESAAQGVPAPPFGFAAQLRAQLRARYPGRKIEVINTGIVAIDSHVVLQIAKDLAAFSPDLYLVYLGNNEVVGPYGPGCAYFSKMPPLWAVRLKVYVQSSRIGQLMGAFIQQFTPRNQPPVEWGGMAMFVNNAVGGDDPRLETVYRNFATNLGDIVRVATKAGAKTLLCTVVSNLKDCPPLLSLHRPGLTAAETTAWQRAFERGRIEWLLGETGNAHQDLREARRIDPQYADTAFMLGSLELQAGNTAAARGLLVEAEHWDALRFRPDPRINEVIRQVARAEPSVGLLDAAVLMGSDPASSVTPAGRELLFEHVHFDWEGNYRLARLMAAGAAQVLFGDEPGNHPWLDPDGCAAALAYTEHERLAVLQHVADIVRKPPFTNQLTYCEDQARLAREIDRFETAAHQPENLRRAKIVAAAASATDPDNPDLAGIAGGIAQDQGDLAGALAEARRAAELLPADLAPLAGVASLLAQLGNFEEAGRILRSAAGPSSDPDRLAPALAALAMRRRRFDEARADLDGAIARQPANYDYQVMRGNVARLAGNNPAALNEFRAILRKNPSNQAALEGLVSLLVYLGQTKEAGQASLELAEPQARNQLNDLRVAQIYEARGDDTQAVRFLQAAESSGPVATAIEVDIAKKLHRLGREGESLLHLAQARRLALLEGDPEITASIDETIGRLRGAVP